MLKGAILGVCIAVFFVSLIVLTASLIGGMTPSVVTSNTILTQDNVTSTSIIALVVSFVIGFLLFFKILGKF